MEIGNIVIIVTTILLLILTIQDIHEKAVDCIWLIVLVILVLLTAIIHMILGQDNIISLTSRLLPGIFLFIINKLIPNSVGVADGVVMSAIGLILNIRQLIVAVGVTMTLIFIASILILSIFRVSGKHQIPMIPFIFGGFIVGVLA